MICFNASALPDNLFGHSQKQGQWMHSKYGLISVIIHEVGNNYFPMIVNDESNGPGWMKASTPFCSILRAGVGRRSSIDREAKKMVSYMTSPNQVPIMSNSESILQFGNNAYGKPATIRTSSGDHSWS